MHWLCDEVFGPVLSVMPFDDEKDAIQLANATEYGLVAAVWTTDGARQARLTKAIRSGQGLSTATALGRESNCLSAVRERAGMAERKDLLRYTTSVSPKQSS